MSIFYKANLFRYPFRAENAFFVMSGHRALSVQPVRSYAEGGRELAVSI